MVQAAENWPGGDASTSRQTRGRIRNTGTQRAVGPGGAEVSDC